MHRSRARCLTRSCARIQQLRSLVDKAGERSLGHMHVRLSCDSSSKHGDLRPAASAVHYLSDERRACNR